MSTAKNGAAAGPRVLFVSHETTLSGAPIQLVHLAGWLHKAGWDILRRHARSRADFGDARGGGVPTVVGTTLLTDLEHAWLRERCREFDVIVANTIASWPAVRAAHLEQRPVALVFARNARGGAIDSGDPGNGIGVGMADLLVTPTQQTARIYEGLTAGADRGCALRHSASAGSSGDAKSERLRFLTLGSFEPRKGQDVLVEAIRKLDPATRGRCQFQNGGPCSGRSVLRSVATGSGRIWITSN